MSLKIKERLFSAGMTPRATITSPVSTPPTKMETFISFKKKKKSIHAFEI